MRGEEVEEEHHGKDTLNVQETENSEVSRMSRREVEVSFEEPIDDQEANVQQKKEADESENRIMIK